MRLPAISAVLMVGAALLAAAPLDSSSDRSPRTLEGDWEAVIASPKRPWIFLVHFSPAGAGWTGRMSIEGLADFPLNDVQVESTRVHFQFPPELGSPVFEGTLESEEILGQVAGLGEMFPARLTRVVELPAPANRLEAWAQDLEYAATCLAEYDRSFTPRAREEFKQAVAQVKQSLPDRSDPEILVALSRAIALSGNAHTWLRPDPTSGGAFSTDLPIRIWWFSDGPYVVRAAPQYSQALRCRVVAIEGHDLSEVRDSVASLFAGTPSWAAYLSPIYLASPDVLCGLGMIRSQGGATFTFEDAQGSRFDLWIRAETIDQNAKSAELWQELSPLQATGSPSWATALTPSEDSLPLYLRHPERAYWFELRPGSELLYFQFNCSDDTPQGPSFQEFGDSLLAFVEQHPIHGVVVDLRFNSGGNLEVAKSFMQGLAKVERINREDRLFVILGRCTFSAGLFHAAQLKQYTRAIFVGEPVGDRLDYWAEGGAIVLPHSRAVIRYSNGFHRYSEVEYPEYRPYYEELRIPNLVPDVSTPLSSADYFSGRDPALEAVEAQLRN